ncbi:hypothetical protein JVU11DRAFT_10944 [Chiua virens]|nr:hypothetical protein JVU11DRAFT_10944 [Chiua virens]
MSEFRSVDPRDWQHDRTWGQFFETFEQFLAFSWPVIAVTDTRTGRAHIVTRMTSIVGFFKMIKTRFGEALPQVDNMLLITPFETSQRHLRHVNDWLSYKKLHATLPAVAFAAYKARVRGGEPSAIRELWAMCDKTFLTIDFEPLERTDRSCFEWGYAAIRSSHLAAAGAWPPVPDTNYRKGHYIISEYAAMVNKTSSAVPWQYAFGETQVISKAKMPRIIQSVLSSLVSPDSESTANSVVLVGHGVQAIMQRLEEMKIKLPNNVLVVDIAYLERALFTAGQRGAMVDRKTGRARLPTALLSLRSLLHSFNIDPPCVLHNAGNDAFMTLVLFQRMVDPKGGVGVGLGGLGVGVGGVVGGAGTGSGKENAKSESNGGSMRRAASVAARLFRPLSSIHVESAHPKANGNAANGTVGVDGTGQMRGTHRGNVWGGADEMGMRTSTKRASMFSVFTSPFSVPSTTAMNKNEASNGSTSGSGSGTGATPSTIVPNQKRYSTLEKQW